MRLFRSVVLYAGLALGANAAMADTAALEALREGSMKKLLFIGEPKAAPQTPFFDADGNPHTLAEYKGKYILLNFWATWCPPCLAEMPSLDRLQTEIGGKNFQVVTIATGRNSVRGIKQFFDRVGVKNMPILLDTKQALARKMGVFGLPISIILDPQGREIARLRGDAEWDSDSAKSIFKALLSEGPDS